MYWFDEMADWTEATDFSSNHLKETWSERRFSSSTYSQVEEYEASKEEKCRKGQPPDDPIS